jgi:hypothetical protein
MKTLCVIAMGAFLLGCATAPAPTPQDAYFANLQSLCGKSASGKLVTNDVADTAFRDAALVLGPVRCTPNEVRIPFAVGQDRSRTWVITRTESGLRLKHDHRHEDGTEDTLSQYGGDTAALGTSSRQEFPADDFSKELFRTKGNPASVANVWAVEIEPARVYAYELRRPNRFFRVEFDLAAQP